MTSPGRARLMAACRSPPAVTRIATDSAVAPENTAEIMATAIDERTRLAEGTIGPDLQVMCRFSHVLVSSEGLRPSDSPTRFRLRAKRYGETSPEPWRRRALARRFDGSLRS